MKKILFLLVALIFIALSALIFQRLSQNKTSITPYPFVFKEPVYKNLEIDAPILIIGDRMAERLSTFKDLLIDKLSVNLSKPIKVATLSTKGDSIHRTLQKIKALKRLPLIIIYMGNIDQSHERLFENKHITQIKKNFSIFNDDFIKSLLMLLPELSQLIYWPIKHTALSEQVNIDKTQYTDQAYQLRTEIHYALYAAAVDDFFNFAKKRSSLIIPLTTPINLTIPPRKSCYGSLSGNAKDDIKRLKRLITKKDYKSALTLSQELALINSSNAQALFLHGQVLQKLNHFKKAQKFNELAIAYDCNNQRPNPIYNVILKKASRKYRYNLFDFHQFLVDQSEHNYVFLDETYPQDFYLKKVIEMLAVTIKKRLKL